MNFSVFLSCARWRTATNPGDTPRLWDLGPALRWVRVGLAAVLLGTRPSLQNLLRLARPSLVRLLHRYYIRGLGRIPTPPSRSCPALAFRLPGPDCSTQPKRRSPVFEDWVLVHMVSPLVEGGGAGLFDYVELRSASRSRLRRCCLPLLTTGSASQTSFSELYPPAHRSLCLRFNRYLTITTAKLEARMVSLFLSCRAFSSPTICRFIPAHCQALL